MKKRSEKNKKLEDEVWELCKENIGTEHTLDMTDEMHTIFCWGLTNAPVSQLRKWKKEFHGSRFTENET